MCVLRVVLLAATLAALQVDRGVAEYSVYIAEDHLKTYYMGTDYEDLITDHHVNIIRDGEVMLGTDGELLLVEEMGSVSGSGSGSGSLLPPSLSLPPLPAHVDSVTFTWKADDTVNYILEASKGGSHLSQAKFSVEMTGTIPLNESVFMLQIHCMAVTVGTGRVNINMTISSDSGSTVSAQFYLEKKCDGAEVKPTTVEPSPSLDLHVSSAPQLPSSAHSFHSTVSHTTSSSSSPYPRSRSVLKFPSPTLTTPDTPATASPVPTPSIARPPLSLLPFSPSTSLEDIKPSSTVEPASTAHLSTIEQSPLLEPSSTLQLPSSFFHTPVPHTTMLPTALSTSLAMSLSVSVSTSSVTTVTSSQSSARPPMHTVSLSVSPMPSSSLLHTSQYLSSSHITSTTSPAATFGPVVPSSLHIVRVPSSTSDVEPSESVLLTTTGPEEETGGLGQLLMLVFAPVAGVLVVAIMLICCLVIVIRLKRKSKKPSRVFSDDPLDVIHTVPYSPALGDDESFKKAPPRLSLWMTLPWGLVASLPRSTQTLIKHFTVERKSLTILSTTMTGEFGCVMNGQLNLVRTDVMSGSQSVSIKMLTGFPEGGKRDEIVRFLENATLMKGIQHPNILPVLRVSVEDNCMPLVVYPMVQYGDMHGIMKLANDPDHSQLPPLTTRRRVEFALQIAYAMKFLTENGITHPDLALRNCLLDTNHTVRVSDGALAQQFYPDCYYAVYGATRPVRWAAVETLQEGLCTAQSNVWSFGVTVWEILTYAEMPYSEVNNNRSILSHIKMGARLPRPDTCPEQLHQLLCTCWNDRGEDRPNFNSLVDQLKHIRSQYPEILEPPVVSLPVDDQRYTASTFKKNLSREPMASIESETVLGEGILTRHRSARSAARSHHVRGSMGSMLSRGSQTGDKLSVTFSVLSASEALSGSSSDEEIDFDPEEGLQMSSSQPRMEELQNMLHEVNTSFLAGSGGVPLELSPLSPHSLSNETQTTITNTVPNQDSFTTLVSPVSPSQDVASRTPTAGDERMSVASNPASVTPEASQGTDTYSKTSTLDLESVSTSMSVPYTSSPVLTASPLYAAGGVNGTAGVSGGTEEVKNSGPSPLMVGHKARTLVSHLSPPGPTAKSTDSGIRSDEESDALHSPVAKVSTEPVTVEGDSVTYGLGLSDLSSSLMAAFDSWDLGSK